MQGDVKIDYNEILSEIDKSVKFNSSYLTSDKFKEYVKLLIVVEGENLVYLLRFINIIFDYGPQLFMDLFGEDYWKYYDVQLLYVVDVIDFADFVDSSYYEIPSHVIGIDAIEYVNKLILIDHYKIGDVSMSIAELLIKIINTKRQYDMFKEITGRFSMRANYTLSVNYLSFIYEYMQAYPSATVTINMLFKKLVPINVELTKKIKKINILEYIKYIKSLNNNILSQYSYDGIRCYFKYYIKNNKIAIKSFVLHLREICNLDDSEDITISKKSIMELFDHPGFTEFIA